MSLTRSRYQAGVEAVPHPHPPYPAGGTDQLSGVACRRCTGMPQQPPSSVPRDPRGGTPLCRPPARRTSGHDPSDPSDPSRVTTARGPHRTQDPGRDPAGPDPTFHARRGTRTLTWCCLPAEAADKHFPAGREKEHVSYASSATSAGKAQQKVRTYCQTQA